MIERPLNPYRHLVKQIKDGGKLTEGEKLVIMLERCWDSAVEATQLANSSADDYRI